MGYPGSNILNQALRVITKQAFQYYAFVSRETNTIGYDVATYADPVSVQGSVQPIPRRLYEQYGLNLQKNYFTFFLPNSVVDVERDVSGDKFIWNSQTFQCESITPWFAVDGWVEVLTIQVPS